jgi:carbohydrate-binding DOMON domain-containing protein
MIALGLSAETSQAEIFRLSSVVTKKCSASIPKSSAVQTLSKSTCPLTNEFITRTGTATRAPTINRIIPDITPMMIFLFFVLFMTLVFKILYGF